MIKLGMPILAGLAVALTGCVSDGTVDNIFKRKASWASFLGGEDIKQACAPGSPEHVRAVYNGNRSEQVRIYDLQEGEDGYHYRSRVLTRAFGNKALPLFQPGTWFNPSDASKGISGEEWSAFTNSLVSDGIEKPVPVGRTLFSGSFFWIVSGCLDGTFQFNVWEYPDPEFKALNYPGFLFDRDPDPIPVNKPEGDERITYQKLGDQNFNRSGFTHYDLRVGEDEILYGRYYDPDRKY